MSSAKETTDGEKKEEENVDATAIYRNIYNKCDTDNKNSVHVDQLIEFIKPYLPEDLNALKDLKRLLDPINLNVAVSIEEFNNAMEVWCQKISAGPSTDDDILNITPKNSSIDRLLYSHSTPRASLGDKLRKCNEDLHNISNVSGYSLSTSRLDSSNPNEADKTILEEEVKRLEYKLSKVTSDLTVTKQQLATAEEQNETLIQDVERLNKTIHVKQQMIENLQINKRDTDELKEESNSLKQVVQMLKKKLSFLEKENLFFKNQLNELEEEKLKSEKKNEVLAKKHQELLNIISNVKVESERKDQITEEIRQMYEELKAKFVEKKDLVDQLQEQNNILSQQKTTYEKAFKDKFAAFREYSSLGNLSPDFFQKLPLSERPNFLSLNPNYNYNELQNISLLVNALIDDIITPIFKFSHLRNNSKNNNNNAVVPIIVDEEHDETEDQVDILCSLKPTNIREKLKSSDSLKTELSGLSPLYWTSSPETKDFERIEKLFILEEELGTLKADLDHIQEEKKEISSKLLHEKENTKKYMATIKNLEEKQLAHTQVIKELKDINKQVTHDNLSLTISLDNLKTENIEMKDKLNLEIERKQILIEELKVTNENFAKRMKDSEKEQKQNVFEFQEKLRLKEKEFQYQIKMAEKDIKSLQASINKKQLNNHPEVTNCKSKFLQGFKVNIVKSLDSLNFELYSDLKTLTSIKTELELALASNKILLDVTNRFSLLSQSLNKHISEINTLIEQFRKVNNVLTDHSHRLEDTLQMKYDDHEQKQREYNTKEYDWEGLLNKTGNISEQDEIKYIKISRIKLREKDAEILKLKEEISQQKEKMTTALKEKIEEYENKCRKKTIKYKDSCEKLLKLQKDNVKLCGQLKEANELQIKIDLKLKEKEVEVNSLKMQNSMAQSKINFHETNLEGLKNEVEHKRMQCKLLNDEMNEKIGKLTATLNQKEIMEKALIENKKKLLEKCAKLETQLHEIGAVTNENSDLEDVEDEPGNQREIKKPNKKNMKSSTVTYNRQQIKINRLMEKLETVEDQLKLEKANSQELRLKLLLSEKAVENYRSETVKQQNDLISVQERIEELNERYDIINHNVDIEMVSKCAHNKDYNISEPKFPKTFIAVDDPSHSIDNDVKMDNELISATKDELIDVPVIKVSLFADKILKELELAEKKQNQTMNRTELENKVAALSLELFTNSNDIPQRLENENEKYENQYEIVVGLIRDISCRLRDHVCIGAQAPIKPVYVLLEEVKMELNKLINNVGQIGALHCEMKMKKCWNLITNYISELKQENEHLIYNSRYTSPVEASTRKRKSGYVQTVEDKRLQLAVVPKKENKNWHQRFGKTIAIILLVFMFLSLISLISHFFCRMSVSENQYCPLDGVISTVITGFPPM